MTAIIQFFTSHFFGNMVYGIINNLITFIFVWFIHAFIPYKPKYQNRKNLTRATLLMYVGLVIISYVREIPGCNAFHIFYPLVALYFVIQLIYLFTVFDGSVAMLLLLFFLEKIIEILGMAVSEALSIWLIPDYMYYYLLDNVRGVWYFNSSIAATELIVWGFCWLVIRLVRYVQRRNARLDIMAYILIPASQFILFIITMVLYADEAKTAVYDPYGVAALVLGVLDNLALFVMIRRMNENAALRTQLEATRMQQSYYTLLEEQQKQIREMQHDINNHVAVIRSLTAGAPEGTDLKQYAEDFSPTESESLMLIGNAGLGKTHAALAIAGLVLEQGHDVIYVSSPDFFGKIEASRFDPSGDADTLLRTASTADLLILDDLGTEFVTPYFITVFYSLLNNRLGAGLPTIITTNITDGALLEKRYTEKISSRLSAFIPFRFLGEDIRPQKAAE